MGTVQSNQWCQQRNVEQLHIGSDGVALPPESVQSHTQIQSFFILNCIFLDLLWLVFFTALDEPVLPSLQRDYPVSDSIVCFANKSCFHYQFSCFYNLLIQVNFKRCSWACRHFFPFLSFVCFCKNIFLQPNFPPQRNNLFYTEKVLSFKYLSFILCIDLQECFNPSMDIDMVPEGPKHIPPYISRNQSSLEELLLGFLKYYATDFRYFPRTSHYWV